MAPVPAALRDLPVAVGAGVEGGEVPLLAAVALGLAAVHVGATYVGFLDVIPRSRLLSAGSGASVAYVFVHVLPEVAEAGRTIEGELTALAAVERHVYLIALVGFAAFYGLEQFVASWRRPHARTAEGSAATGGDADGPTARDGGGHRDAVFWVHVVAFAVYNAVIGYLLVHRESGGTAVYAAVMGLHLLVVDYGLRDHHREAYRETGRWILAAAVPAGTVLGVLVRVDEVAVAALFAFLAGGIVLNSIKEELPERRESRFTAFAAGAAVYAGLLLFL